MFGRIGGGGNKGNDKNTKGGDKGNSNNDKPMKWTKTGCGDKTTSGVSYNGFDIIHSYPSNTTSKGGEGSISGGGGVGSQSSSNENHNGSGYSLTAIQNLPRIATDTEFAATGHGNIAVESIVHHAIQQNSTGKGINAISSLQMINLSYNKLNDNDLCNLNTGLIGYTLNLKVFNLSYNNFSDAGIDYLIKGLAGVQYLQAGGRELSGVMQGLFTHYNVNITTINLSNNHIGDIGADIISNAIVTNSLPHVKALNLADNNITDTGAGYLAEGLKNEGNKLNVLHLEGNKITTNGIGHFVKTLESPKVIDISIVFEIANNAKSVIDFIEKGLKYAIKQHAQSKWEVDKIRSNVEGEKWKGCKDMALNVGMGLMSESQKCLTLKSDKAIFLCAGATVGWELLRPETLDCFVETKEVVGEIYDDNCCIF